ncbi:fungal-specific transcription factor domain-containing protein [Aspergillus aurantiobrunneus]
MSPGKSFAKRRHATMACVPCRESKVKCDGAKPACSNCANRNRDCRYQAVDKRKLPLRVAIELLSSRVDQLCSFIRANGLRPPPMSQEKDTALGKVLEMLGLAEINSSLTQQVACESERSLNGGKDTLPEVPNPLPVSTGPSPSHDLERTEPEQCCEPSPETQIVCPGKFQNISTLSSAVEDETPNLSLYRDLPGIQPNNDPGNWTWQLGADTCIMPTSPYMHNFLSHSTPSGPLDATVEDISQSLEPIIADDDRTLVDEPSSPEDIEGLIDELSDRVGTLQVGPGGQTQFYGPTSTFNLVDMLATTNSRTHFTAQNDALECSRRLGSHKAVPAVLEEHLTNLYFSWQDPSFHVVDRRTYEAAKAKWYAMGDTPYYSESLRNAMCALGASFETRYHPNFITFPKSLVDFFGDRAKALLEVELDSPCVATVQALVICSSLEVGSGREARGWLYSGMAIRLAFNLALHLDMSSYVSNGVITLADADLRRTVFWAAYTVDHQLGFHLGRPFRTNMEDVTVGKPINNASRREPDRWTPYVSPDSMYAGSGVPDCLEGLCEEQVNLCEIMAPCGDILYGTSSISKVVLQQLNERIVAKLLNWKARLPLSLQINLDDQSTAYIPQVLLLHMQYYQNIIYAHRPWMSKSHLQPQPPKGPGHGHARKMCIQSAIAIAKILVMYETRYTLRRIHTKAVAITSSAVLLLLFAAVTEYPSREPGRTGIAGHLSTCFRALDEFAISWPSASRAKDLLLRLQRRWEIRTRPRKGCYRVEGSILGPTEQSSSPMGLHGPTSKDHETSREEIGPHGDINIDTDIDWMLMPEGKSPSENRAADLYSLLSNPVTIHPERGSI